MCRIRRVGLGVWGSGCGIRGVGYEVQGAGGGFRGSHPAGNPALVSVS